MNILPFHSVPTQVSCARTLKDGLDDPLFRVFCPRKQEDVVLCDRHPLSYELLSKFRDSLLRALKLSQTVDTSYIFPTMDEYYALGENHPRLQHDKSLSEAIHHLQGAVVMTDPEISGYELIVPELRTLVRSILTATAATMCDQVACNQLADLAKPVVHTSYEKDPRWLQNTYLAYKDEMERLPFRSVFSMTGQE